MSRNTAIPKDDPTRSHLTIWRQGWAVACTTSLSEMPAGPGLDQGLVLGRHHQLVAELGREVLHEEQADDEGDDGRDARDDELALPGRRKWLRVRLATMLVMRLPATGPTVQKPMAEARPSWGL